MEEAWAALTPCGKCSKANCSSAVGAACLEGARLIGDPSVRFLGLPRSISDELDSDSPRRCDMVWTRPPVRCWEAVVSDWLRKWPGEWRRWVGKGRVVTLLFTACCMIADASFAGLGEDRPERRFIHGFGDDRPAIIQALGDERPSGGELGVVAAVVAEVGAVERLAEDEGVNGEYL